MIAVSFNRRASRNKSILLQKTIKNTKPYDLHPGIVATVGLVERRVHGACQPVAHPQQNAWEWVSRVNAMGACFGELLNELGVHSIRQLEDGTRVPEAVEADVEVVWGDRPFSGAARSYVDMDWID